VLLAKKPNHLLGCFRQNIASRLRKVIFLLYLALVQHIWSAVYSSGFPVQERHILDEVHHRAKKMFKGLELLSYKERLRKLGLLKLERRRLR